MGFVLADLGAIKRPVVEEHFESIFGMRKSFGFLATSEGRVNYRECDCWCPPCVMTGPHRGTMNCDSIVSGCVHKEALGHKWYQCDVARKDTRGVMNRRNKAQEYGRQLAEKLKPGAWVAVQERDVDHPQDPYMVGRVMDAGDRTPIIERVNERKTVNKTLFTKGDYMVAVRWCHRDDADSERLTFIDDKYDVAEADMTTDMLDSRQVDVFNATELRAIDLTMNPAVEEEELPRVRRSTRNGGSGRPPPPRGPSRWKLHPKDEEVIIQALW